MQTNQIFCAENLLIIQQKLLSSDKFMNSLSCKLTSISSQHSDETKGMSYQKIQTIVEELCQLISSIIKHKLQNELKLLIIENNQVLQHIKSKLAIQNVNQNNQMSQFSDIRQLINKQKNRILMDQFNDVQNQKSISTLNNYDNVIQKFNQLNQKVKSMEQKYETNFKSLWNVLSMTEAAVFQHVRQNKIIKISKELRNEEGKINESQNSNNNINKFISKFWK